MTLAAVLECLVGLALILAPDITIAVLLGVEPHNDGVMIGRVMGVALVSLGIACWGARTGRDGVARAGTLHAITLYNAGAGLLLVVLAATGNAGGPVIWIAGVAHLGLALAFAASLWSPRAVDGRER